MFGFRKLAVAAATSLALVCLASPVLGQRMVVAIAQFENEAGADPSDFNTLRSHITDSIVNTRKFEVVERQNIKTVLSERTLVDAGLASEEGAPEAGKLTAAGYVMYGSVLSLGVDATATAVGGAVAHRKRADVEIQLRIADAETGSILMSKTITGTGSKSRVDTSNSISPSNGGHQMLQEAIRDASSRVTEALMDLAFPVKVLKVGANSITVNLPQESTEINARYSVWSLGEELLDPDTGESLGADEEYVGDVVITVVKPKFSNAVPVGDLTLEEIGEGMVLRRVSEAQIKKEATAEKAKQKEAFKSRF